MTKLSDNTNNVERTNVTKKFVNLSYETMDKNAQKKFREKRRTELFAIIAKREMSILKKDSTFDSNANFESFKEFITNNYNLALSQVDAIFKGQADNNRKQSFAVYIAAFKVYLSNPTKAKVAKASKAKKA